MRRADVVTLARSWVGTPYVHQQAEKGAGCDCLGLLRGVWRELGGKEPAYVPPYTMDWSEASQIELLWLAANHYLRPAEGPERRGDVLLFRMADGAVAKHLGILTETADAARFVHAYSGHGVVENSLSLPWRRRMVARFCFPEIHEEMP
ncbi:NlpC/P60 family protein [Primorskyibacter sp. S187A]|uniref:NlpC/P60 family protein n=1 Tax=Primorskyibacter sp. S187A TaxID=3415130 RepID=UPI003C79CDC6